MTVTQQEVLGKGGGGGLEQESLEPEGRIGRGKAHPEMRRPTGMKRVQPTVAQGKAGVETGMD